MEDPITRKCRSKLDAVFCTTYALRGKGNRGGSGWRLHEIRFQYIEIWLGQSRDRDVSVISHDDNIVNGVTNHNRHALVTYLFVVELLDRFDQLFRCFVVLRVGDSVRLSVCIKLLAGQSSQINLGR